MPGKSTDRSLENDENKVVEPLSDIGFLARSFNRWKILSTIYESPQSPSQLQTQLGIPQTTLRRNLVELEEKNWIEESPVEDLFRILPTGKLVCECFSKTIKTFQTAESLNSFLNHIPQTESLPPVKVLEECEVIDSADEPYAPMLRFVRILKEDTPSKLRAVFSTFNPIYIKPIYTAIDEGMEFEFVGSHSLYSSFKKEFEEELKYICNCERANLYLCNELPEFGVGIIDGTVLIMAYDQSMRTHAILKAYNNQNIHQWSNKIVKSHLESSSFINDFDDLSNH